MSREPVSRTSDHFFLINSVIFAFEEHNYMASPSIATTVQWEPAYMACCLPLGLPARLIDVWIQAAYLTVNPIADCHSTFH
jgi:hypothetical protein